MYRYMALIWDPAANMATAAHSVARRLKSHAGVWESAVEADGLLVLHTEASERRFRAYDLTDGGVVLGCLFRSGRSGVSSGEAGRLTDAELTRIHQSRGRSLADQYWGRYVAFVRASRSRWQVLRDPTGGMPCFFLSIDGLTAVFSHMEDGLAIATASLSIDWNHIRGYLQFNRLVSSTTGFREVTQVLAGECVEIGEDTPTREFYWHPVRVVQRGPSLADPDKARRVMRDTVVDTIHCWASLYERILHELSGGLDSSIVVSCLASARPRPDTMCFNLYTETPEGDERVFARAAAARAGFPLSETRLRPSAKPLSRMLSASNIASPAFATFQSESEEIRARLAADQNIEAIFSGQGGDHLFLHRATGLIVADYFRQYGLGRGILRCALGYAQLTGSPLSSILRSAVRHEFLRRGYDPYAALVEPFAFAGDSQMDLSVIRHQWINDAACVPVGKQLQIFDLIDTQYFYMRTCRYADLVHPLISQPIMECCMCIPTYVLTQGGVDRGLTRSAFSTEVPAEILARTSKGGTTSYHYNTIVSSASFLREFLLDGALVREGVIDKARLEAGLSDASLIRGHNLDAIIKTVLAEAWVESSARAARRIAA